MLSCVGTLIASLQEDHQLPAYFAELYKARSMANFTAKILGNSVSAMTASQALLSNASNNIANVNTPGYTRRDIAVQTRIDPATTDGILRIGNGVQLGEISRVTNSFLEDSLRKAVSRQGAATVRNEYLARVENVFSLTGPTMTVGSTLNDFFSAVNQLGVDPSNLDLRLNVLQKGEDLVSTIRTTYQELAKTQNELDQRVGLEVGTINSMTKQVAYLNSIVAQRESVGVSATDERDQRDTVLAKLAEKISFNIVETPNGMVNCVLENGFPLVNQETSRDLSVTATPTFGGATMPRSLSDSVLSYVVYNFGTADSPSHLDLTQIIKNGGGSLGGVLQMRGYADPTNTSPYETDGDLVALATRVEALTRTLITEVNQVYRGADEDVGNPGVQPSAGDLNGNTPGVFGLFDFDFSGVKDVDGDGAATASDLIGTGLHTFSNILKLGISTPDQFAAARDLDSAPGNMEFATGDGSNAQALAGLRTQAYSYSLGALTFTGTFDELYNSAVSTAGNMKSAAQLEADVANASYMTASSKRDEFSSVNLDEEFANVIKYQKAFQASARMIKTASEIIDVIVSLI